MATVSADQGQRAPSSSSSSRNPGFMKVALPHLVAIAVQLPMFLLFVRQMMCKAHYQTIWLAIVATVAIAWVRWPREERTPYRESNASNVFLILGLIMAFGSIAFVNTWFCAASVMLLVLSLLLKVADSDRSHSLWTAALPLFVFLPLPFRMDTTLITTLQRHSAWLTSRLLDLLGLGHYLDGTTIHVPGKEGYGIAEACSGVQSFFTLLFIAVVMMVVFRRVNNQLAGGTVLFLAGVACLVASFWLPSMLYVGLVLGFWALLGLRATGLIAAAIFWAMFINVIRILLIPILDINAGINLSSGIGHMLLGWGALLIGLMMLMSTDQLLLFLFGPVDQETGESGPLGKFITKTWNQLVSGNESEETEKKKRKRRVAVKASSIRFAWVIAGILAVGGLWQLTDVTRGFLATKNVQFFDADITLAMGEEDLPSQLENWALLEKNGYQSSTREHGSDLGRRSDQWQYRGPNCRALISFDQTFPGWHELTTCYINKGWKLEERVVLQKPDEQGKSWPLVQAKFKRETGEQGYLLFSHFNGGGEPESAPVSIGTLQSIMIRAKNRLSNRLRRSLFSSETYQVQVFVQHYGELNDQTKGEITDRYLEARESLRVKFLERSKNKN